ncbi:MAG: hypothetical protein OXH09_01930 [Gammaproteobacteria bacterium]|nr:hypothetical protein [Gammaproteobacteria bacterium]
MIGEHTRQTRPVEQSCQCFLDGVAPNHPVGPAVLGEFEGEQQQALGLLRELPQCGWRVGVPDVDVVAATLGIPMGKQGNLERARRQNPAESPPRSSDHRPPDRSRRTHID